MYKNLVIAGTGFPEVIQIINDINSCDGNLKIRLLGFIDDNPENTDKKIAHYDVMGGFEWIKNKKDIYVFNSIARNTNIRLEAKKRLDFFGAKFLSLIHPNVNSTYSKIGKGVFIGKNTYLGVNSMIGNGCIIQENCSIGHDVVIKKNCFFAPGCNILGNVHVDDNCYFGAGSVVYPDLKLPKNVTLGMNVALSTNAVSYKTYFNRPPYAIDNN